MEDDLLVFFGQVLSIFLSLVGGSLPHTAGREEEGRVRVRRTGRPRGSRDGQHDPAPLRPNPPRGSTSPTAACGCTQSRVGAGEVASRDSHPQFIPGNEPLP
jgi:hypothetical protein